MAAELFLLPFRPALDLNAVPVPGAALYFYATGTTTPQAVYADEDLTVSLGYIVEADAAGAWPSIFLDASKVYRVEMRDATGAVLPNSSADPYVPGVVDALAPEIAASAASAIAASVVAVNSSESAAAISNFFPSRAAGEAATVSGEYFTFPAGDGSLSFAQRTSSGSNIVGGTVTKAYIDGAVDDAEAAATDALSAGDQVRKATWPELAAVTTEPDGRIGVSLATSGTHASLAGDVGASGGQTPDGGEFRYTTGVGWVRLGDLESQVAKAYAQSPTPPDPNDPTSKSAKTWAAETPGLFASSSTQNLWFDPFFKRLRAAYPTAAASMLLNGLRRVNMGGAAPVWEATDNRFGSRGLTSSVAITDYYTWLTEYGVPDGAQINESVAINIPTGTTFTIQPVIQPADFSANLVVGTAVTIVGTGAVQVIPLDPIATPENGSGKVVRLRVTRTVGSGSHTMLALGMFQGAQQRPISKVDVLGAVSDNAAAVAPLPAIQASVSAWQAQTGTVVDGSYISNTGAITTGGATNRYVQVAVPSAVAASSGPVGAATPGAVRVNATMPGGTGYWLATFYSDEACTTYIGHQFQGPGGADVSFVNQVLALPAGTRGLRINTRTTAVTSIEFYATLADLAQRVAGSASGGFAGKPAAALGDSITAMARWFSGLASALGLSGITNCGVGGTTVSKPDVNSSTAISMCDDVRINAMPTGSKLILFDGGTNDHGQSRPIGTLTNIGVTTFDNTTYIGALEQVAIKLLARFNAGQMIVWWVPIFGRNQARVESGLWTSPYYNLLGLSIEAYQDAFRLVAKKYGFPVVDMPARLGWNTQNASLFYDPEGTDGTTYIHPNAARGGPAMAAIMADELMRLNRAAALVT